MSKTNMTLLELEPKDTLHFCKTPMTTSPSRVLKLTNANAANVAFKVKTTAPKAYLVRPASGTLRPKETQEVQIILQPQGMDGSNTSHRFLVQATAVDSSEPVSREYWTTLQKEALQEQRLNVVLEEQVADDKTDSQGGPVHRFILILRLVSAPRSLVIDPNLEGFER